MGTGGGDPKPPEPPPSCRNVPKASKRGKMLDDDPISTQSLDILEWTLVLLEKGDETWTCK